MRTVNARAAGFAQRHLFLADPDVGFVAASLSLRVLADEFCADEECPRFDDGRGLGCRLHARAMTLGVAKMLTGGDVLAELSAGGILFVRLSAKGVLAPLGWGKLPHWFTGRSELVEWAESVDAKRRWEARV